LAIGPARSGPLERALRMLAYGGECQSLVAAGAGANLVK
jgi:hypothetical protein